jgi:isoleucyl-tRNA synthetase
MKASGADILRLWVASADYAHDIRFGPGIVKHSVEAYRKLRNTLRWMLGALAHLEPKDKIKFKDMHELELERLMLHRLCEVDEEVREAYATYDYRKVVALLSQFMNSELSAFYFDIRKDALYCEPHSSVKRRAGQCRGSGPDRRGCGLYLTARLWLLLVCVQCCRYSACCRCVRPLV